MREPQQLAYRSGGVGLAPRTVPWAAMAARGRLPQPPGARPRPVPRGRSPQPPGAGGWHACPARGAGTPERAGGWHAWPARGAGTPGPRGGLARLASRGSSPLLPKAFPARGLAGMSGELAPAATGLVLLETLLVPSWPPPSKTFKKNYLKLKFGTEAWKNPI